MNLLALIDVKFKGNLEKIDNILRHYSLRKIQDAVYIGEVDKHDADDLAEKLEETTKQKDSVIMIPICKNCYSKKKTIGREIKFKEDLYRIY